MQGFNILGLNRHEGLHRTGTLNLVLEGAPSELDSFKEVAEALKNYYTKDEITSILSGVSPEEAQSLSDYLKKAEASELYLEKGNYLTEHLSLIDYAKKSDIPDVDSFLTKKDLPDYSNMYQPKGDYLTEHQDISNLATKDELFSGKYSDLIDAPDFDTLVNTAVSAEMSKLTEGASENFDTFKEISDWISTHGTTASDMIGAINDHAKDIGALETKVTALENANYLTENSFEDVILTAETEDGEIITFTLAGISSFK